MPLFLIWFVCCGFIWGPPDNSTAVSSLTTRGQSCTTSHECVAGSDWCQALSPLRMILSFSPSSVHAFFLALLHHTCTHAHAYCHNTCLGKPRLLSVLNHSLLLKDLLLLEKHDPRASPDELEYINRLPFKSPPPPVSLIFFFSCSINNSSAYQNTFLTGDVGLSWALRPNWASGADLAIQGLAGTALSPEKRARLLFLDTISTDHACLRR